MSAIIDVQQSDVTSKTHDLSSEDFKFLDNQLREDRNAIQKSKANAVDVLGKTGDGERVGERSESKPQADSPKDNVKKIKFQKGEQSWEIDEDALADIKADKSVRSLTVKELRDKAAGEIAVENRMRDLSEKRKEQESFIKKFTSVSKTNPAKALEIMIEYAAKSDPELNFNKFIDDLAKQAESLGQMTEAERRAYELDQKLKEKDAILKDKENEENFNSLRENFVQTAEISHETFDNYAEMILQDPVLSREIKSSEDLVNRIDDFHFEVCAQQAAHAALSTAVKGLPKDDALVFDLADVLKQNPDWEPEDVIEVAQGILKEQKRNNAAQTLSRKQRSTVSEEDLPDENLSDAEFLAKEILKDRQLQQFQKK